MGENSDPVNRRQLDCSPTITTASPQTPSALPLSKHTRRVRMRFSMQTRLPEKIQRHTSPGNMLCTSSSHLDSCAALSQGHVHLCCLCILSPSPSLPVSPERDSSQGPQDNDNFRSLPGNCFPQNTATARMAMSGQVLVLVPLRTRTLVLLSNNLRKIDAEIRPLTRPFSLSPTLSWG